MLKISPLWESKILQVLYIISYFNILGDPDPEEQQVYTQSSPSTSSISSFTKPRKISRSASVTSDISPEKTTSEISPKTRSMTRSQTESPSKPGIYDKKNL